MMRMEIFEYIIIRQYKTSCSLGSFETTVCGIISAARFDDGEKIGFLKALSMEQLLAKMRGFIRGKSKNRIILVLYFRVIGSSRLQL